MFYFKKMIRLSPSYILCLLTFRGPEETEEKKMVVFTVLATVGLKDIWEKYLSLPMCLTGSQVSTHAAAHI